MSALTTEPPQNGEHNDHGDPASKHKSHCRRSHGSQRTAKRMKLASTYSLEKDASAKAARVADPDLKLPQSAQQHCLVSLKFSEAACIQTCHVVPRTMPCVHLTQLEYAWGHEFSTLDLATRQNVLRLIPDLNCSFNQSFWAFVPYDIRILQRLATRDKRAKRIEDEYENRSSFDYILFPLPNMDAAIFRLPTKNLDDPSHHTLWHERHTFPFEKFPVIKSHVPPHYMIYNLMAKLLNDEFDINQHLQAYEPLLKKHQVFEYNLLIDSLKLCHTIFDSWVRDTVPGEFTVRKEPPPPLPPPTMPPIVTPPDTVGEDEVGLAPSDSHTHVPKNENASDYSSDEDDDEITDDETSSVFNARMGRWVGNLPTGLEPPPNPPTPPPSSSPVKAKSSVSMADVEMDMDDSSGGDDEDAADMVVS